MQARFHVVSRRAFRERYAAAGDVLGDRSGRPIGRRQVEANLLSPNRPNLLNRILGRWGNDGAVSLPIVVQVIPCVIRLHDGRIGVDRLNLRWTKRSTRRF
jgi:hypothetical protein